MISRRQFLVLTGTAVATGAKAQLPPNIAEIRKAALQDAVAKVVGNAQVRTGRVKLDIPPLIDNGNAVPITVEVESPMSAADHVKAIHVFTERNPQPYVFTAHIGPRAGKARIATRARIGDSGDVIAIAQMSDGSFWQENVRVIVTLSACLEDGLI
jgi:sulfur-oxidizing protein SoxY